MSGPGRTAAGSAGRAAADLARAADRLHERVFVAAYTRVQARSEAAGMRELRRALVADARGRVLEVGAGTGLNVAHYGPAVDELLLVEPTAAMREVLEGAVGMSGRGPAGRAELGPTGTPGAGPVGRADPGPAATPGPGPAGTPRAGAGRTWRVLDGTGEALPAADASVDTVVGTFVLCSVEDPAAVLREVARVLRPGGRYLGLEHVRSASAPHARGQDAVAPAWRWAVRGCRCNQDTAALVAASPLALETVDPFDGPRQPWPVRPGVRLVARRP